MHLDAVCRMVAGGRAPLRAVCAVVVVRVASPSQHEARSHIAPACI